jgi:lipid II:glycine glycyltransferase (peptidoglycan interpeptide bridge formation enzyme)
MINDAQEIACFNAEIFLNYVSSFNKDTGITSLKISDKKMPLYKLKKRGFTYYYNFPFGLYPEKLTKTEIEATFNEIIQNHFSQFTYNVGPETINDKNEAESLALKYGFSFTAYNCHLIDTSRPIADIFNEFSSTRKKHIKRYQKAGLLNVFRTKEAEYFQEYFSLYKKSAARWGSNTSYSKELIAGLHHIPGVYIWVAELNGKMLSAMICFYYEESVFDWLAASIIDDDVKKLYAAVAVQYEVIRHASENNFSNVNMGASLNLEGVSDFKDSWGAVEKKTYTFIKRKGIFAVIKKLKDILKK